VTDCVQVQDSWIMLDHSAKAYAFTLFVLQATLAWDAFQELKGPLRKHVHVMSVLSL
jgi:hypothetical protein